MTADERSSVPDDVVASNLANAVSLAAIEAAYGDDAYGEADEWAETVPDLGETV